ncbi:hypothetical protein D3C85_1824500 [compost metagenome]
MIESKTKLVNGVYSDEEPFLYNEFVPHLVIFGLVETLGSKIKLSKLGLTFIGKYQVEKARLRKSQSLLI